jgi:hypothetical protein
LVISADAAALVFAAASAEGGISFSSCVLASCQWLAHSTWDAQLAAGFWLLQHCSSYLSEAVTREWREVEGRRGLGGARRAPPLSTLLVFSPWPKNVLAGMGEEGGSGGRCG